MEEPGKILHAKKKKKRNDRLNSSLFERYIVPVLEDVKSLVKYYTTNPNYVDENYDYVIEELLKYIHSYDKNRPIKSWLHVCIKRAVYKKTKERQKENAHRTGLSLQDVCQSRKVQYEQSVSEGSAHSLMDSLSDELYDALMQLQPAKLHPFLLQLQGYKISDIVRMEYESGRLDTKSERAVVCRISSAKVTLRNILSKNGYTGWKPKGKEGQEDR